MSLKKKFINRRFLSIALPVLLLAAVSVYSVTKAVHTYATGSDALVYTYLLHGAHPNQIVLPGQHTNILKLPFFWITSLFPYNYTTFMLASVGLVLASIGLWAWLLIKVFGKRHAPLILVLLAALIFSSTQFDINIAENTIRNIEFPLALWFIMIINTILKGRSLTNLQGKLAVIGCLLYGVLLAGDNYFLYATSLPLLIVIAWYWAQSQKFTRPMTKAALIIAGTFLLSVLIKAFLSATGLLVINKHIAFQLSIVPAPNLGPSLVTAASQFLHLQGAYIFGQSVNLHNLALFVNFGLMIGGLIGLLFILFTCNARFRQRKGITDDNGYIFSVLALSFVISFLIYVFSGQVVQRLNGQVLSLEQSRYLAFMPLLLMGCFIWLIVTYYGKHKSLIAVLVVVLLAEIITIYPSTKSSLASQIDLAQPSQGLLNEQAQYLRQQGVHEVLSGYWDGAPLRFISHDDIRFATIVNCNHPFNFNVREDWYQPDARPINTALVVDRAGPDHSFWNCDDATLEKIYGQPDAIHTIGYTSIWVYHYDTRQKLMPFALTYY